MGKGLVHARVSYMSTRSDGATSCFKAVMICRILAKQSATPTCLYFDLIQPDCDDLPYHSESIHDDHMPVLQSDLTRQTDTWILDLSTSMWTCWYGTDPTCKHQVPNLKYSGPGKIAFLSQVQLGMYVYLFGGARVQIMPCSALGRGSTGNIAVGTNALDMWVMDMSKLSFQKVSLDVGASPKSTLLSAMVVAAEFPGYKTPLVLAGGADVSCASSSPPCAGTSDCLLHRFREGLGCWGQQKTGHVFGLI